MTVLLPKRSIILPQNRRDRMTLSGARNRPQTDKEVTDIRRSRSRKGPQNGAENPLTMCQIIMTRNSFFKSLFLRISRVASQILTLSFDASGVSLGTGLT